METQRENFQVKVVNNEEVHVGDVVDVVYDNGEYSEPGLVVEITNVVPVGKTTGLNRDLFQVTGVVEFVDDIAEYDDMVAYVFAA